uniref:tripartite tricarboxylate transporter substrate-binding protein n=1 Tax=Falsiroseomonas sp. TaxID=2870721 RepID=UPI003F72D08B
PPSTYRQAAIAVGPRRRLLDNRPGGNTLIATEVASRAPADGYTLLQQTNNLTINPHLHPRAPVHPLRDFIPLSLVSRAPHILIVNNDVPARTVNELVGHLQSRPRDLNFGTGGTGTTNHIAAELFMKATGTAMEHIPYRGASEYMNDLLGGRVHLVFAGSAQALPLVQQGAVRALGITGRNRFPDLPDLPTLLEAGLPVEIYSWTGYLAPAGTPEPIVAKIAEELRAASRNPRLRAMLSTQEVIGSSREEFADFLRANMAQMGELLRSIGPGRLT